MGENTVSTDSAPKKKWFKGLKSEFKKIVWPDKESLAKQTLAVIVLSVFLGVIITGFDKIIQFGIEFIIR